MDYSKYCSLTFNGQLLDDVLTGYTTTNVEGRSLLDRVLSTVDVPGRDGAVVLDQKLPAREIRVHFAIKGKNAAEKLTTLNALHDKLKTDGDVQFKFGDETHHRFGRLSQTEDPPYDQFQGIGSFTLYCQDPYKYKAIANLTGTSITIPTGPIYPYKINEITLTFPIERTGLTINNTTTGRKIILTGSFTDGQVLQILPNKILLDGQNIMNRLDYINSDWREFELRPGNVITSPISMTMSLLERAL